jgi:DUF4097 and DUF4098 domain-containing protein YvlB
MMRNLAVLMFCAMVPGIYAQETPYIEREEKQFNFFPGGNLTIAAGAAGNVKIIGWPKGSIRVEAEKIVRNLPPETAKAVIAQNPIKVHWDQTAAGIQTAGSLSTKGEVEINLVVYVPKDKTDIAAKIRNGNFSVDQLNGWVEATILQGDVEARSVSGYFSVTTEKGDVRVDITGKRWFGRELAAVTHAGSINLLLPIDYSAALQLETRNGKISVDYPNQIVDGEVTPPDIIIRKNSQSMRASVGDGGSPISLVTFSGDVTLSKKQ